MKRFALLASAISMPDKSIDPIDAGVPSVFFGIGGSDPGVLAKLKAENKPVPVNHSPYFAPVPEPSIRMGVEVLTLAVMTVAGKGAPAAGSKARRRERPRRLKRPQPIRWQASDPAAGYPSM